MAVPTNHTYSIPNSTSFQSKVMQEGSWSTTFPPPPPSRYSPTHTQLHRTKSFNSHCISTWSNDQYVEMVTNTNPETRQAMVSTSCPTLNMTELPSSESETAGDQQYGHSLTTLEPDYATIPSSSTPYLVMSAVEPRPNQGYHIQTQCSDDGTYDVPCRNRPLSPNHAPSSCHDYEEIMQVIANSAYLETAVSTDHCLEYQSVLGDSAQAQSPASKADPTSLECLEIQRDAEED